MRRVLYMPFSIAASWTWAVALLVSGVTGAKYGIHGLLWFVVPNILTLVVFGFVVSKMRNLDLHDSIEHVYGYKMRIAYQWGMLGIQTCAIAVQFIGSAWVLAMLTGFPYWALCIGIGALMVVYTLRHSLIPAMASDMVYWGTGTIIVAMIAWAVMSQRLVLAPVTWQHGVVFDYGIVSALSLFAAPFADQQQWQRARHIGDAATIRRWYTLAALLFAPIVTAMGTLGLTGVSVEPVSLTAAYALQVAHTTLPWILVVLLVVALLSTTSNALAAAASLNSRPRETMVAVYVLGTAIALSGVSLLHLWLFYGSVRSLAFIPTVFAVAGRKITTPTIMALSLACGLAAYLLITPITGVLVFTLLASLAGAVVLRSRWGAKCNHCA